MANPPSLGELAAQRVGVMRAPRVLSFMVLWHLAEEDVGDEWPGTLSAQVRVYANWSRESERTVWRHLDRFRDAFPTEVSPSRLMAAATSKRPLPRDRAAAAWALGSVTVTAA